MQAETLCKTKEMSREEWLEERRKGIGGSDAAAVAGVNPFKSRIEVYLEKLDEVEPPEDNAAMRIGRDLEDYVAERFAEETSKKVYNVNQILQHPHHSWMLANIDRRVVGEHALLECKTTVDYHKNWDVDEYPTWYEWQVQHYLAVTGYDYAYLTVFVLNRREILHYKIDRDEDLIDSLIQVENNFWHEHVLAENPPEFDGSKASSELIKKMYPEAEPEKEVELDSDVQELIEKRNEYKEIEKKYKKLRKEQENQIKDRLGEAEVGMLNGEKVVKWKNIQSTRFNKKKFREEHSDLYEKYTYKSGYRRLYL